MRNLNLNSSGLRMVQDGRLLAVLIGFLFIGVVYEIRAIYDGRFTGLPGYRTTAVNPLRVASIVETRALPTLVPLILHMASVLGPSWPFKVFYGDENAHLYENSRAIQRHVASGRITLIHMGNDIAFNSHQSVSAFFANTTYYWDLLDPAVHALIFQSDSILCSNSDQDIDEFLEYDFIGAPISPAFGQGFNGGLSIRNVKEMKSIINRKPWPTNRFEDQWFYENLIADGAWLPSEETASRFAVETIWREQPFGLHQPHRWQKENLEKIDQWCPEWRLLAEQNPYNLGG